jgi:energy-coupling factor transporter ATP-binding protein EcfA2
MSPQALIRLQSVNYIYEGTLAPAISQLNLSADRGDWLTIVGPGGSGKTTLCRLLCGILHQWPGGTIDGSYQFNAEAVSETSKKILIGQIGAVFKDPESSLIHEIVADELAFGPENLHTPATEIDELILEALTAVDMPHAADRRIQKLSGGQQQRIAIASLLTMKPQLLILDDATSNLDAPARDRLEATLLALHAKGHTIVTTTSRWEGMISPAQRLICLDEGAIIFDQPAAALDAKAKAAMQRLGCYRKIETVDITTNINNRAETSLGSKPVLEIKNLSFDYPGSLPNKVFDAFNLTVSPGDFLAVLGPNGSGKTTLGKLVAGLLSPPKGSIALKQQDLDTISLKEKNAAMGYLFQQPDHQFVASTVFEECAYSLYRSKSRGFLRKAERTLAADHAQQVEAMLNRFNLMQYRDRSPHELTDTQKRLLNLASTLIMNPDLIILDEPTAGMDYNSTDLFLSSCAEAAAQGKAILMISHDLYAVHTWVNRQIHLKPLQS